MLRPVEFDVAIDVSTPGTELGLEIMDAGFVQRVAGSLFSSTQEESEAGRPNLRMLVLGCIGTDLCKSVFILEYFLRPARLTLPCTFGIQSGNHEKRLFKASPGREIMP